MGITTNTATQGDSFRAPRSAIDLPYRPPRCPLMHLLTDARCPILVVPPPPPHTLKLWQPHLAARAPDTSAPSCQECYASLACMVQPCNMFTTYVIRWPCSCDQCTAPLPLIVLSTQGHCDDQRWLEPLPPLPAAPASSGQCITHVPPWASWDTGPVGLPCIRHVPPGTNTQMGLHGRTA